MRTCKNCGCTDERACPGGCFWVDEFFKEDNLCSKCAPAEQLAERLDGFEASALGTLKPTSACAFYLNISDERILCGTTNYEIHTAVDGSPVIVGKNGLVWTIDWKTLLAMALAAGVDGEVQP